MSSFDDDLRGLFEHAGPAPDSFSGDLTTVRRTVRRRKATRQALATTFSVLAVGVVGLVWNGPDDNSSIVAEGGTTSAAPPPSIRDVDLRSASFAPPCPDDDRSVTLEDGAAGLALDGALYVVNLVAVGYADVDGDGHEDAVVGLHCFFAGASTESYASLQAYRLTPGGDLEQIGPSQAIEGAQRATPDGATITVDRDVFAESDARCCPSAGARETWRFDGTRFVLDDTTPIPPPGAPG